MPDYRRLHNRFDMGERTDKLTDFELRVWLVYRACADDFGVCPFLPGILKGKSRRLAKQADRVVTKAMDRLIAVGLCHEFTHQGLRYLCQSDWQDYEDLRFPRTSTDNPAPPLDVLGSFTEKTRKLFAIHPSVSGGATRGRAQTRETQTLTPAQTQTLEGGSGETKLPPRPLATRAHLIEAPSKWSHAYHEGGFCDWMCFPADLFDQFTKRIERSEGLDHQAARKFVAEWADGVRASGINPTGKMYDFWNGQWERAHGSQKPAQDGAAGRHERTKQRLDRFVENG